MKKANDRWRNSIPITPHRRPDKPPTTQTPVGRMKSIAVIILLFEILQYADPNAAVPAKPRPVPQALCVCFEFFFGGIITDRDMGRQADIPVRHRARERTPCESGTA